MSQVLLAWVGESEVYDIDCTDDLDTTETITSVISIAAVPVGLSMTVPVINVAPVVYKDGRKAAIGKVVQVQISDMAGGKRYDIKMRYTTSKGADPKIAHVQMKAND